MSKIVYHYDSETMLFVSESIAEIDTQASTDNTIKYLIPPNSTFVKPPVITDKYRIAKFDIESNSWNIVDDFRGCTVVDIKTKEILVWNKTGVIPSNYTTVRYKTDLKKYIEWSGTNWVVSEKGRELLLNDIWDLRKLKREQECSSDLNYNNHMIHVDPTSFNDIMLAAQEALISGDMTTTKRWVTADNTDVQLNGTDFLNIARLYGQRRQNLVYESNELWQLDMTKTNDELVTIYRTLKGGY